MVCGVRFFAPCAQADRAVTARPAATAGTAVAVPRRNMRRLTCVRLSTFLIIAFLLPWSAFFVCSAIPPMLLQYFDAIAIGIGDEEKLRHQRTLAMELLHRARLQPFTNTTRMFVVDAVHHECDMPVPVAQRIRRRAVVIDRQLQFEIVFRPA